MNKVIQRMNDGLFITFEGPDGNGKSTQIRLLKEYLEEKELSVTVTREPGALDIGKKIRDLLLNPVYKDQMTPEAELFLYEADRALHTKNLIIPALKNGSIVISDRYYDSTTAYQGVAGKIDLGLVLLCNKIASYGLIPDITFYLHAELDDIRRKTTTEEFGVADRPESKPDDEKQKRIDGFYALSTLEPERIKLIKYIPDKIDAMQSEIRKYVDKILKS